MSDEKWDFSDFKLPKPYELLRQLRRSRTQPICVQCEQPIGNHVFRGTSTILNPNLTPWCPDDSGRAFEEIP